MRVDALRETTTVGSEPDNVVRSGGDPLEVCGHDATLPLNLNTDYNFERASLVATGRSMAEPGPIFGKLSYIKQSSGSTATPFSPHKLMRKESSTAQLEVTSSGNDFPVASSRLLRAEKG